MAVINITDKLNSDKPKIRIGEKEYEVDDSLGTVFRFEELAGSGSAKGIKEAVEVALGVNAAEEIGVEKMSISNFRVLATAVMAAVQRISYDEAAARFQKAEQQ